MQTGRIGGRRLHVTPRSVDRRVMETALRQHGCVTTAQLLAAGLHRNAIMGRARRGTFRLVHRGVYLVGAPGPYTSYAAAVLACGDAAVLSHRAAAHVWGFAPPPDGPVDVTVTRGHRRSRPGIRVHHAPTTDTATRQGIRLTGPRRTLTDLEATLPAAEYARALNEARLLRLPVPAAGGPTTEMTRSEAERRLLRLIEQAGLPRPRTNTKVCGYEVDFHWPEHALVVEFDGWAYHSTRAAFERDRRRDADLQAAGQRVMRVTDRQLKNGPLRLAVRIAQALSAIRPAPGPLVN